MKTYYPHCRETMFALRLYIIKKRINIVCTDRYVANLDKKYFNIELKQLTNAD